MRHESRSTPDARFRLCFLSYQHLSTLARAVIDECSTRADIELIDSSFDAALALARERERGAGVDAFVSAGANASFLRGSLSSPVATINVSGYDILVALLKARAFSDRVGVVTYRATIPELDAIKELLRIDVAQRAYLTPDEATAIAQDLAHQGYKVIIGSSIVVEAAERLKLKGILAYSVASVRQGLEDALEMARLARLENARYDQLNGVLQSLQDAVLAVDHRNTVIAMNPAMEELLGIARAEAVGRLAGEVEPELSLARVLERGEAERGVVLRLRRRDWIANRMPIRERGRTTGALITLYDALAIKEADVRLRSQRKRPEKPTTRYHLDDIRGESAATLRAKETARRFAGTDLTVLISGESGTGKELFAQAIHNLRERADGPFVAVNCSAFPETLLESELFGYEDGAFTGSRKGGKFGLFEAAHTGTLFLDEIGDMPLILQTRLLRVLQEREIIRLGSVAPIPIDVRVVAATHQPLDVLMRDKRFRSDLYYRLNTLHLRLTPLRERPEDIDALALSFMRRCLSRMRSDHDPEEILQPLLPRLRAYGWPGNVRELENICERLAMLAVQFRSVPEIPDEVLMHDCPEIFPSGTVEELTVIDGPMRIEAALAASNGNRQDAARRLGISRATLWRRMRENGIAATFHETPRDET